MRIEVHRSGGFAGIARRWTCDTATLPAPRAAEIERLVASLVDAGAPAADAFVYRVTIDGAARYVEDAEALIDAIG